jgi:acetaldehyde dehydrogenase (acetylating)
MKKLKAAIIGSGNIGTDLMIKILRQGKQLEMGVMVGIDPASDGLARAARMGVATTHEGVDGLVAPARVQPTSIWCSTPPRPAPTSGTTPCCGRTSRASSWST